MKDLRVLAIRAEPPEVLHDADMPAVELTTLLVDPRDPEREVTYRWMACGLLENLRCGGDAYFEELGDGTARLDEIHAVLRFTDELREAALEADTYAGFGGTFFVAHVAVQEGTREEVDAIKQIPGLVALPPGTALNSNPSEPAVRRDGADWPVDEILEVSVGQEIEIEPLSPAEDSESYSVFRFDLQVQELDEHLGYDFLASAGSWNRESSGGPPDPIAEETTLASFWTAPQTVPEGEIATIWIVVRDGRGGTAWTSRLARVER